MQAKRHRQLDFIVCYLTEERDLFKGFGAPKRDFGGRAAIHTLSINSKFADGCLETRRSLPLSAAIDTGMMRWLVSNVAITGVCEYAGSCNRTRRKLRRTAGCLARCGHNQFTIFVNFPRFVTIPALLAKLRAIARLRY